MNECHSPPFMAPYKSARQKENRAEDSTDCGRNV